jgi:hypothetical protein
MHPKANWEARGDRPWHCVAALARGLLRDRARAQHRRRIPGGGDAVPRSAVMPETIP